MKTKPKTRKQKNNQYLKQYTNPKENNKMLSRNANFQKTRTFRRSQ